MEIIQTIIGIIVFLVVLMLPLVYLWSKKKVLQDTIVIKIIPNQKNEKTPAIAEHLFSILHGIYEPLPFWKKVTGETQIAISFEVVKIRGKIHFFVRSPQEHVSFIRSQFYAHYPESEIEQVKDFFTLGNAQVEWSTLRTEKSNLWPIKRFPQFEDKTNLTIHDPLSGILQSLNESISAKEMAGIQISIRPFNEELFRDKASKALRASQSRELDYLKNTFEKTVLAFGILNILKTLPWKIILLLITKKTKSSQEGKEIQTDGELKLSHEKESVLSSANDKMSRLVFETEIRIFHAMAPSEKKPFSLKAIGASFKQFSIPYLNSFTMGKVSKDNQILEQKWKNREISQYQTILSSEELATLFHLPHESVDNPNVHWVSSRKISAPQELPISPEKQITCLGETNYRGQKVTFGIRPDDRRRHIYIAGKTGMGKSTLLENMIFSDIQNGKGVAVVDPHGDLADSVLEFVPKHRTNDVIWFDPSDKDFPISFNILECPNPEHRHLVASGVVGVFKKMFAESWGPRLEHILRNTLLALIEAEGQSLLGVLRMLGDSGYRKEILKKVKDPVVLQFWEEEFGSWQPRQVAEAVSPIQNKVGQFLSSSVVRNILGQTKSSFSLRFAMDTGKIMIINLSKGKIGEDVSALLGAMMITKFQLDVMSRSDIKEKERKDFYLYVDEFQNFATQSFATILSEARKYKLNLTVANQYLAQMDDEVREAVFGNVGSLVSFQVGFDDAKTLCEQFGGEEVIEAADIGALPKYQIYLRLMIDGMPSKVFSAGTLFPPSYTSSAEQIEKIKNFSRQRYAKPRKKIEEKIEKWSFSNR